MKNKYFLVGIIFGVLLVGTFSFIGFNEDKQEIEIEKKPFEKDFPELQKKIDYKIEKFYYDKYNQRRVIFEWD